MIANAGVSGQSTIGHIRNFEVWFPQVENLRPKYILFYIGVNDYVGCFMQDHAKGILTEPDAIDSAKIVKLEELKQEKYKEILFYPRFSYEYYSFIKNHIKRNSIFYHVYTRIRGYTLTKQWNLDPNQIRFNEHEYIDTTTISQEHIQFFKEGLEFFTKRLQLLILYSEKMGAEPIFITQPTMFYTFDNGKVYGVKEATYYSKYPHSGVDYYHMLNLLNETIRNVCADKYSVVELTSLPIWREQDFYDFVHTTPSGSAKVAEEIYKQIEHKLQE